MATTKERIHFINTMAREFPHVQDIGAIAERIMFVAATYGRLQRIALSDRPLTDNEKRREAAIEAEITAICKKLNASLTDTGVILDGGLLFKSCQPDFSGDPRGATIKLRVPSGYNDSFGGEGLLCVPTS